MTYDGKPWRPCDWPPLGPSYREVKPVTFQQSGWPETMMMVGLMVIAALVCTVVYLLRHHS